eukprot:s3323_g12.t1
MAAERYGAEDYISGLRGKNPVEIKVALAQAIEAGVVCFKIKMGGLFSAEAIPSQFLVSVLDTEQNQVLWTRAESNLAPTSWQTGDQGSAPTSVNLMAREERE